MAEEKPITIQGLATELLRRLLGREALMLLAFTVVVGVAAVYATSAFAQSVDTRVDAGIGPVEQRLDKHLKESDEAKAAQARFNERVMDALQRMEDRSAQRFDALQNTILDRRPQPNADELARPAPVGGDGGR